MIFHNIRYINMLYVILLLIFSPSLVINYTCESLRYQKQEQRNQGTGHTKTIYPALFQTPASGTPRPCRLLQSNTTLRSIRKPYVAIFL